MRRTTGRIVLAVVFAGLALNGFVEVISAVLGRSHEPAALVALQALVALVGAAAAWGTWAGTRWAPAAALLYGLMAAVLVVSLTPILGLPPEASRGLWVGGAACVLFGVWAAWYLRRSLRRTAV
ncbi:MAG TPA: hypothetical protein VHQ45_12200 [Gemmatimonadaceae bacterium]|jgi:hypothetical protein|nr:hypothetical protein [Gemmatimonadaceae bacterium]